MLLLIFFSIGFVIGLLKAKRMKGSKLDQLQYGTSFGIASTILCLFLEILILRLGA
tara:strand:- start:1952 stop:2119 length:168 start_codon:yes stop_codon:yes gene_type:complete